MKKAIQRKLLQVFYDAVESVRPKHLIRGCVNLDTDNKKIRICEHTFEDDQRFQVIGFGKAVYGMAVALHGILEHRIRGGVLSIPHGSLSQTLGSIAIFPGAENNLPDENSVAATEKILNFSSTVSEEDVMIVLISGGGSSLFCKPVSGLSLEDKLNAIRALVTAGATIQELNTVRTCLSAVKGGGLARVLSKNTSICLILSDVIGDPVNIIASGPTVLDSCTDSAIEIVRKYKLELKIPKKAMQFIKNSSVRSYCEEKGKIFNHVIGNNRIALDAVIKSSLITNYEKHILSSSVAANVSSVAQAYHQLAYIILLFLHKRDATSYFGSIRSWCRQNESWNITLDLLFHKLMNINDPDSGTAGVLLVAGGETTVELLGKGKGGRNQELSLQFSKLIYSTKQDEPDLFRNWDVMLLCGGTDGIDGPTDAAGAVGSSHVILEGVRVGCNGDLFLENNDSYTYFSNLAQGKYLVKTGHTGTNVMDIHLLLFYKK